MTETNPETNLAEPGAAGSRWRTLAVFLMLCFAVYGVSGAVTASSVGTWYQELAKPPFTPADWVFAPVWTVIFILMAVAGMRAWHAGTPVRGLAMLAFGLQLALNFAWTVLFFGLNALFLATLANAALLAAVGWCALVFWRRERLAGLLMAPYAAWVAFALLLSFEIWRRN